MLGLLRTRISSLCNGSQHRFLTATRSLTHSQLQYLSCYLCTLHLPTGRLNLVLLHLPTPNTNPPGPKIPQLAGVIFRQYFGLRCSPSKLGFLLKVAVKMKCEQNFVSLWRQMSEGWVELDWTKSRHSQYDIVGRLKDCISTF